ncbi:DUF5808 domain-containing protein [Streptomyces sp. NPDC005012]|uniref:DUF5808 domain-containing protein n=1 Tax=Streptomyces sp. NPDC005012 TaxID=3154558 RepID=UPI00339F4310
MTRTYLHAVREHLGRLTQGDRRRALVALRAQLDEFREAGLDPASVLGSPAEYAAQLVEALSEERPAGEARWRLLGLPVETRGPVDAEVRSRVWDPADPRLIVPRLFGLGWRVNLGAFAVRLGLIRPDDMGHDVLEGIPARNLRLARSVPLVIAGATVAATAFTWRSLPRTVASGFGPGGRARGRTSRTSVLGMVAIGAVPALWSQRPAVTTEEALVRAATATSLAVLSASVVAATVADARHAGDRWGLLTAGAVPVAALASTGVVLLPLRSGLRHVWRTRPPVVPAADTLTKEHQEPR